MKHCEYPGQVPCLADAVGKVVTDKMTLRGEFCAACGERMLQVALKYHPQENPRFVRNDTLALEPRLRFEKCPKCGGELLSALGGVQYCKGTIKRQACGWMG